MKMRYKKRLVFLGLIFTVLFVFNLFKTPVVIYLPFNLPDELKGTTIPPFGIFILEKYKNEKNPNACTVLQHELEHWNQYTQMGLFSFHYHYLKEFLVNGRINHWMEREANKNCKIKLKAT
jgi:hypothetical protein